MFGQILNSFSSGMNLAQFKIGEFFFPVLEPFCRILENRNSVTRKYFQQALKSFNAKKFNIALLNLNMVLSLHPNHFLARIYRARFYVWEKRFQLAAEDYVLASQVSRFRFIHYGLYQEYFISLNGGSEGFKTSLSNDFRQIYKMIGVSGKNTQEFFGSDSQAMDEEENYQNSLSNLEGVCPIENKIFTGKEREKFLKLGPITRKEIKTTNWEILSRELSLKNREP